MRSVIETIPGVHTLIDVAPDGSLTTGTIQDCVPIAEEMKAMHNAGAYGSSEMRFAGRIPLVFVEKYCQDSGIEVSEFMQNREHIRRLMSDPALDHFRVWKGAV